MIATLGNIQSPRPTFLRLLLSAVTTDTVANFAAIGTLGLLARLEGQGPLQPINATSHWLHGPQAGRTGRADFEHTGIGYATNHAATVFWALPFTWWLARRPRYRLRHHSPPPHPGLGARSLTALGCHRLRRPCPGSCRWRPC